MLRLAHDDYFRVGAMYKHVDNIVCKRLDFVYKCPGQYEISKSAPDYLFYLSISLCVYT